MHDRFASPIEHPDDDHQPERDLVPLRARTDAVNARLEQLDKMLAALHDQLEPVLMPSRPHPLREPIPERSDTGSWLADYLDATARRVEEHVDALRELLARVEL